MATTTTSTPTGTPASAPAGARPGTRLACSLLPPAGAAQRRLIHYEHKSIKGSTDYYVISHYSGGGYIRRRYNSDGFMVDVDPVFVVA